MKYRKKPVIVDAIRFSDNHGDIIDFVGLKNLDIDYLGDMFIKTLEGNMAICDGDYVIKGVKGEFYPCKPDIFLATYEPVE